MGADLYFPTSGGTHNVSGSQLSNSQTDVSSGTGGGPQDTSKISAPVASVNLQSAIDVFNSVFGTKLTTGGGGLENLKSPLLDKFKALLAGKAGQGKVTLDELAEIIGLLNPEFKDNSWFGGNKFLEFIYTDKDDNTLDSVDSSQFLKGLQYMYRTAIMHGKGNTISDSIRSGYYFKNNFIEANAEAFEGALEKHKDKLIGEDGQLHKDLDDRLSRSFSGRLKQRYDDFKALVGKTKSIEEKKKMIAIFLFEYLVVNQYLGGFGEGEESKIRHAKKSLNKLYQKNSVEDSFEKIKPQLTNVYSNILDTIFSTDKDAKSYFDNGFRVDVANLINTIDTGESNFEVGVTKGSESGIYSPIESKGREKQ